MTDRPVLEAVGEVLAEFDNVLEEFNRARSGKRVHAWDRSVFDHKMHRAEAIIARLEALGYRLSPTPIVNAGEER